MIFCFFLKILDANLTIQSRKTWEGSYLFKITKVKYSKDLIKDLLLILIGSLIFSLGVNFFIIPNLLSEGGILGITVVVHYLFDWSPGVINFVLNLALFIVGYKFFDLKIIYYTVFSIFTSSFFIYITEDFGRVITEDTLLAAIFAGLLIGFGLGLIFRAGGTIGGTTVIAKILNQYIGITIGTAMLIIDIVVVVGSVFVIGLDKGMYTFITVYIGAKVIDYFVEGIDKQIGVFIISSKSDILAKKIIYHMSRGITVLDGAGGYTGHDTKVLYTVISQRELVPLKKYINEIDQDAYVTVHHVQEIVRRGYKANIPV